MKISLNNFLDQYPIIKKKQQIQHSTKYITKNNNIVKIIEYNQCIELQQWRKCVEMEIEQQFYLAQIFPQYFVTIFNYAIEDNNQQQNIYIAFDCQFTVKPLLKFIYADETNKKEKIKICEQILQIAFILNEKQIYHRNLQSKTILYSPNTKSVLLTDFGSARVHYQNFTEILKNEIDEFERQAFLQYCPQNYISIMQQNDSTVQEQLWLEVNENNSELIKQADMYALGIIMLQLFNQNEDFNSNNIEQYLENLRQKKLSFVATAIEDLINCKKPSDILSQFYQQSQQRNQQQINEQIFQLNQQISQLNINKYPKNYYYCVPQQNIINNENFIDQTYNQQNQQLSSHLIDDAQTNLIQFTNENLFQSDEEMKNESNNQITFNVIQLRNMNEEQILALEQFMAQQYFQDISNEQQENIEYQLKAIDYKKIVNIEYNNNNIKNHNFLSFLSDTQITDFIMINESYNNTIIFDFDKIKQIIAKFEKMIFEPKVSNLITQDLQILNQFQLQVYLETLENLSTNSGLTKQQKSKIFQWTQNVKQLIEQKVKEEFQQFYSNPQLNKLMTKKQYQQLSLTEQRNQIQKLQDMIVSSTQQTEQNILQQQLDKISQQNNVIVNSSQNENHQQSSTQKATNNKIIQPKYLNQEPIYSNNIIIRSFQQRYFEKQIQIPDTFLSLIENLNNFNSVENKKYDQSIYSGHWEDEHPNGLGCMMKSQYQDIFYGIFKKGVFIWGQVLQLNPSGQLVQYIGQYHETFKVKHGKKILMEWYTPRKTSGQIQYDFEQYASYNGCICLGEFHGEGTMLYSDQSEYNGEWKRNCRSGNGILTIKQNNKYLSYEGEFENDQFHGKGIVKYDEQGFLQEEGLYTCGKPVQIHKLTLNGVFQKEIKYE